MRKMLRAMLFVSMACLGATAVWADGCHGPSAPSAFPEPSTATQQDVVAAQQSVKQYLTEMESALKCMEAAHNDQAHDIAVSDMQKTAAKFNTMLRAFKARQKA